MAPVWGLVRMPKEAGFTFALIDEKGSVTVTPHLTSPGPTHAGLIEKKREGLRRDWNTLLSQGGRNLIQH